MYSDITNTFLKSIRALRFYVNSVERNMENCFTINESMSSNAIVALMLHTVLKAKQLGIDLNDEEIIEKPENAESEEFKKYINYLSGMVQEKIVDGKKVYKFSHLPKEIKEEYRKYEINEKQDEILYSGALMLLITYFENLVSGVLKKDFILHPERVSLEEKSVSYKLLTEVGSVDEIREFLIDQEVTNKMYGSVDDWKKFFQKQLKLQLESWEKKMEELQEIIARRNLYVHNNGIINNIYISLVPKCERTEIGKYLTINREYIDIAIDLIEYLGMSLAIEAWLKECSNDDAEVTSITNLIYDEYLCAERWDMAKYFYKLCLANKKMSTANRMICQINMWQCYKWIDKYNEIEKEVNSIDLSAYKPMFVLGILALQEKYVEFFNFFDNQNDIGDVELKEWPLFRELRKSEEYQKRFPEVINVEKEE